MQNYAHLDLDMLNPPQREAVMHQEGPMLVLAGAGSGKTRVIIARIARLMADGVPPSRILGVTFTNKSAREMRERLRHLAGKKAGKVRLSTFHSLGLAILQEDYSSAGLRKNFCIYDTSDQIGLVREMMRQVRVADRRLDASKVLDVILRTKRERRTEVMIDWGDDYELAAHALYTRYVDQMRAFNAIDFDDLILRAQDILTLEGPRKRWSQHYDYILVDEYQDTSPDQLTLLSVLAGEQNNICAVGDDDQRIYGLRGADSENILRFGRDFKGTHEVILDQNYRSTNNILKAANSVIQNNKVRKEKVLWSDNGDGNLVEMVGCPDGETEGEFVAGEIASLLFQGHKYEDIAVLYRSNVQSRIFEEIFAVERIPYRIVGGQSFFDRKEVRDAMAYLTLAHNPSDEIALRRIINFPTRGIGTTSLERLIQHSEKNKLGLCDAMRQADSIPDLPKQARVGIASVVGLLEEWRPRLKAAPRGHLADLTREYIEAIGLREAIVQSDDAAGVAARRFENLAEVVNTVARYESQAPAAETDLLSGMLRTASLDNTTDDKDDPKGQVTLTTLHSAKGLEFPYVFLVGMEEEILPHIRSIDLGQDLSEERRLCYVGITRAKQRLWMTWAKARRKSGKPTPRTPSRFALEIPEGEFFRRWDSGEAPESEDNDAMADDFFAKMRAKLGD